VLLVSGVARATEIDVDCPRLDARGADEVRARAKLVLRATDTPPRSLLIACDVERAWIVWDGPPLELLQVPTRDNVVEATLDALDARLRKGPTPAASAAASVGEQPSTPPVAPRTPAPTAHETPTFGPRTRDPVEPRPVAARPIGGLGLGVAAEYFTSPMTPAAGPRLDIGVGWNELSLALFESARFGSVREEGRTFFYDVAAGVGWGAPYAHDMPLGAVLASGVEWFNIGSHTATTGISTLGLRGAIEIGALSLMLGVDGRFRYAPQYFGETVDVRLPRFSVMTVVEGVLLVQPPSR